jgi:tRNA (guanine37-N1)-methyltransferase
MRFDLITIFPEFFAGPLDFGIVRRAREARVVEVAVRDLRDFTHDRHRTVDDRPFGGGEGMVLKPEPIFEAVESLVGAAGIPTGTSVVLLSASGKLFRQQDARRLAGQQHVILICGRYEGVDERVAGHLASDEISVGDFVLSGGELPAAMILDAVTRLLPGALGNEDSALNESFTDEISEDQVRTYGPESATSGDLPRGQQRSSSLNEGFTIAGRVLLDCPHYTRPQSFSGWDVPEVLMSGNHEQIRRWRHEQALAKTARNRPDLLAR